MLPGGSRKHTSNKKLKIERIWPQRNWFEIPAKDFGRAKAFYEAMLINELCRKTGLFIHTIRYYENLGLIQGVTDENVKTNNYKNYDDHAAERLAIIADAKEVGFTLAEIRKLLESWYGGATGSRAEQAEMFRIKIAEIEARISQLKRMKKRLEQVK